MIRRGVLPSRQGGYHDDPRELTSEDLSVMELPDRFWTAQRSGVPSESRCREVLDGFCSRTAEVMRNRDPSLVLFHGEHRSGKTSAAAVMAKAARAHRFSVFYLDAGDILRTFPTDTLTADEEQTYRERAYSTDLLVLDGLGGGYSSNEFVATETAALLKHRQDHRRLTVVTTSVPFEALKTQFGAKLLALFEDSAVLVKCNRVQVSP